MMRSINVYSLSRNWSWNRLLLNSSRYYALALRPSFSFYSTSGSSKKNGSGHGHTPSGGHKRHTGVASPGESLRDGGENQEFYDVIIAGGGLVGTALAVALGKLPRLASKKILLLESAKDIYVKRPGNEGSDEFSNRVVALSPGSKKLLEELGIWKSVWRSKEVSSLQVWDALSNATITFNNPDYSVPVSYIVENPVLAYAISKALGEIKNVKVEFGSQLKSCIIPPNGEESKLASVALKDNRQLKTTLLVGADGFNSKVRTTINSPYINFNYDRIAVVANLRLTEPTHNNVAWQRFLPTGGPIALLPLSDEYSSLVWSTTPERAKELLEDMSPDDFVDAVNSAYWQQHARSLLVQKSCDLLSVLNLGGKGPRIFPPSVAEVTNGSRATFPLGFGHAAYYVSRRAVLIGDAAHRVHPLAGQGLNLGFGDIECLQRVVDKAAGLGGDIGSLDILREYETERQSHNFAVQSGIDFLHRLYSFDIAPVVALRTVGLSLVNSSEMLKKFIMAQAAA